jgi:hypothetical protein
MQAGTAAAAAAGLPWQLLMTGHDLMPSLLLATAAAAGVGVGDWWELCPQAWLLLLLKGQ